MADLPLGIYRVTVTPRNAPGLQGIQGPSGPYLMIQYSIDGATNWHDAFAVGADKYVRFSVDEGEHWTNSMRFIGIDGEGAGDVVGPGSSTGDNIAVFSDASGKAIKDSGKSLSDIEQEIGALEFHLIDDPAPTLGADLDVGGNNIVSSDDDDIAITPDGDGQIIMGKGVHFDAYIDNGTGSATIDWRKSNKQLIKPNWNRSYAFTAPGGVTNLTLVITVDASRSLTWPVSVSWRGGAPETTAAGTYIATFFYDGTTYYGTCTGKE